MANLSKLKRRNTLGAPPPLEEASQNLNAPEVAPVVVPPATQPHAIVAPLRKPETAGKGHEKATHGQGRLDGRSLRKSGRTLQLATRVSWEFDDKLRHIAQRDGLKLVEVLERGLDAYEAGQKSRS
jgi:hypothetical protein